MSAFKMWLSTLQTKRLKNAVFLHDEHALKQYENSSHRAKQIILCGSLIYSAIDKNFVPPESDAIAQTQRLRDNRDYKGKKGNWFLWIEKSALRPSIINRSSIFIAQDQYVAYGQKVSRNMEGRLILIGGATGKTETNVEMYFFEKGLLTGIEERIINASQDSLASSGGAELFDLMERRLEEIAGSFAGEIKLLVAAPLADYPLIKEAGQAINVEYVGKAPFERLVQPTLTVPQASSAQALSTQIKGWALPVALACAGAGAGYYFVSNSLDNYSQAATNFKRAQAAQSPDMDNSTLGLLQAKGVFLDEMKDKRDYPYFEDMTMLLKSVGDLPGIYISQVRFLGNPESRSATLKAAAVRGLDGGVPDLQMVVHLPLPDGYKGSLRDHSRAALARLSNNLRSQKHIYRFTAFGHQQTRLLDGKQYNMFELRVVKALGESASEDLE